MMQKKSYLSTSGSRLAVRAPCSHASPLNPSVTRKGALAFAYQAGFPFSRSAGKIGVQSFCFAFRRRVCTECGC